MKMKRWMQQLLRCGREESGNTLVIVAISLVSLLGFAGLVVDGGSLFLAKSKLQKALDAAVLAGAQELKANQSVAKQKAIDVAATNGFTLTPSDFTTGSTYIEVNKTVTQDLTFAKVLGFSTADVHAVARAEVKGGVVPVGIPKDPPLTSGSTYQLNLSPGNGQSGNYRFLDMSGGKGGGANDLEYDIKYGVSQRVYVGMPSVNTQTGDPKTAEDAFLTRLNQVVILPLTDFTGANGQSQKVPILGFASFLITKVDKHVVYGQFVSYTTPSYGISGIKLTK